MSLSIFLMSLFTLVELNCENLFDCQHDSQKNDTEFLPNGTYRWTPRRYWQKLNRVGQTIIACGGEGSAWQIPDVVALCEVENDSVMRDLTKRSLLRKARYEYVMTHSPDERGIDVALMYSPMSFALINHRSVRIKHIEGMRPTRDLLYASGLVMNGDTIHIVVAHFPSRRGGELHTRPYRMQAASQLCEIIDSVKAVSPKAKIIVAGDLNEYADAESLRLISTHGMSDISKDAIGQHGALGTYKYMGQWNSLDHIMASPEMTSLLEDCTVADHEFLLKKDEKHGGVQPRRNFLGPRYANGFSDHLPLVARFKMQTPQQE